MLGTYDRAFLPPEFFNVKVQSKVPGQRRPVKLDLGSLTGELQRMLLINQLCLQRQVIVREVASQHKKISAFFEILPLHEEIKRH